MDTSKILDISRQNIKFKAKSIFDKTSDYPAAKDKTIARPDIKIGPAWT